MGKAPAFQEFGGPDPDSLYAPLCVLFSAQVFRQRTILANFQGPCGRASEEKVRPSGINPSCPPQPIAVASLPARVTARLRRPHATPNGSRAPQARSQLCRPGTISAGY